MEREVRRVPENWEHPKDEMGRYIPIYDNYENKVKEFQSRVESKGVANALEYYDGGPKYSRFMHPDGERTHYMMYETTSEGTPISPAFATPEELARWLADTGASAFGSLTATYQDWLSVIATFQRAMTNKYQVEANAVKAIRFALTTLSELEQAFLAVGNETMAENIDLINQGLQYCWSATSCKGDSYEYLIGRHLNRLDDLATAYKTLGNKDLAEKLWGVKFEIETQLRVIDTITENKPPVMPSKVEGLEDLI